MRNVVQLCLAANNILLMSKRNHAFLLLAIVLAWRKADRFASRRWSLKNKLGDRMIKELLNSVIVKYRDLPVSRTSIICLSFRLRQIIDLLATDKSRYFAQPRLRIVKYCASSVDIQQSILCIAQNWWTALSLATKSQNHGRNIKIKWMVIFGLSTKYINFTYQKDYPSGPENC